MDDNALFVKVMERKLLIKHLSIIENWFRSSVTGNHWGSITTSFFKLSIGVRQGSTLSLAYLLFSLTVLLIKSSAVAKAAILHLDVSASSYMLTTYCSYHLPLQVFYLCLIYGTKNFKHLICSLLQANWFACTLAHFVSKPAFASLLMRACLFLDVIPADIREFISPLQKNQPNFDHAKSNFYRAFNGIMAKIGLSASHDDMVPLLHSKCFPILRYGAEACNPTNNVVKSLDYVSTKNIFMQQSQTASQSFVSTMMLTLLILALLL